MKVREVIRFIEQDGWHHVRTKGSHRQFQHSIKPGTVTWPGNSGWTCQSVRSIVSSSRRVSSGCRGMNMEYLVVIEKGETSYGAYVPDLPGCVAVGETRREVLKLIREGIELHIEALREAGEPVPPPTSK